MKKGFIPILKTRRCISEKGQANSNYVMVLAFHNTILFMCMRT
jgi:hypothetical protein